jgi:hypothetical protein
VPRTPFLPTTLPPFHHLKMPRVDWRRARVDTCVSAMYVAAAAPAGRRRAGAVVEVLDSGRAGREELRARYDEDPAASSTVTAGRRAGDGGASGGGDLVRVRPRSVARLSVSARACVCVCVRVRLSAREATRARRTIA